MISKKMEEALNNQINAESYSAYLYMSMSSHFKSINLNGFANWMEIQAQEEFMHAKIFYNYLIDRGGRVKLNTIEAPKNDWESPQNVFDDTYKHEQKVTELINKLVDISIEIKDHATNAKLQWFVNEQVEEEASALGILEKIKLTGNQGSGLFMLDNELGQRIFNAAQFQGLL